MKRILMAAAAATTLAASIVPAYAQLGFNVDGQEARLQSKIQAGIRSGALTPREASRLQGKLQQINDLRMRMRYSGNRMNWQERQKLQNRLNSLNNDINRELSDFDRNYGFGRGGGFWHR